VAGHPQLGVAVDQGVPGHEGRHETQLDDLRPAPRAGPRPGPRPRHGGLPPRHIAQGADPALGGRDPRREALGPLVVGEPFQNRRQGARVAALAGRVQQPAVERRGRSRVDPPERPDERGEHRRIDRPPARLDRRREPVHPSRRVARPDPGGRHRTLDGVLEARSGAGLHPEERCDRERDRILGRGRRFDHRPDLLRPRVQPVEQREPAGVVGDRDHGVREHLHDRQERGVARDDLRRLFQAVDRGRQHQGGRAWVRPRGRPGRRRRGRQRREGPSGEPRRRSASGDHQVDREPRQDLRLVLGQTDARDRQRLLHPVLRRLALADLRLAVGEGDQGAEPGRVRQEPGRRHRAGGVGAVERQGIRRRPLPGVEIGQEEAEAADPASLPARERGVERQPHVLGGARV
jgi:hypothetical protein